MIKGCLFCFFVIGVILKWLNNDLGDPIASNTKVILPLTTNTLDMSLHKFQIAPLLVFNNTR